MFLKKFLFLFSALIVVITFSCAKEEVITAVPKHFPPHFFLDENAQPTGFAIEVYEEIAKLADLEIKYVITETIRDASAYVEEGKADAMPNSGITPERLKKTFYTSAMETFQIRAFKRKNSFTITSLEDIQDKKVVVVKNNVGVKLMRKHPKELLLIVENEKEAIFSLLSGESDIFVFPATTANKLLEELNLKDKIIPFGEALKEIKRGIRINKNKPELAKKLNSSLEKFIHTKKYQEIYIKYFGQHDFVEIKKSNLTIIQYTIASLIVVLLIIIAFFIRTNRLKNEINRVKKRFETMFQTHDAIMLLVEPKTGKIIDANRSASEFYGYSTYELLSMKINDLNMLSAEEIKKQREEATKYKHNYFEFPHKLKDGTIRMVEVHSSPIETDNGIILFSIIKDITKLKEYEEELEHSNEELQSSFDTLKFTTNLLENERQKYKTILDLASDGIHILDQEGNLLQFSHSFARSLGYSEDEMRELNVKDWDITIAKDKLHALIKELMLYPKTFETKHKRKDGTIIDVQLNTKGIKLDNQKYLYSSARDITVQKQLQNELLDQKEEFETIFNYAQDGITVIDLEGNFIKFNDAFMELTGYAKEELVHKNCEDITAYEDKEKSAEALKTAIDTGHLESFEKTCIMKTGERISINMSISLLPDKKRLLLILKDTTDIKLMEEQTKLASMGEMIGNIAHQWRQPLSVITTSASGMKMQSEFGVDIKKEEIGKFSDLIVQQAQYLSNTIDNFRDFLKGDTSYSQITIGKVFKNTFSLVSATIKNNNIQLITDIDEKLTLFGSINELTEAFINIINNAKDVLKENIQKQEDRLLFIYVRKLNNDSIEIKIKDSGGGVPEDIIDRIFEPYFTSKHQSVGTGLGLSMAEKIIRERHKGSIEVYNEEFVYNSHHYKGACFRVIFKLSKNV